MQPQQKETKPKNPKTPSNLCFNLKIFKYASHKRRRLFLILKGRHQRPSFFRHQCAAQYGNYSQLDQLTKTVRYLTSINQYDREPH